MSISAHILLQREFDLPFARLGRDPGADARTVVLAWPAVPVEIVRAAGFVPVVARASADTTPAADDWLESGVFPGRLRRLVEAALTGRLAGVAAIVLPRTSDADYKCFLYLRELVRRGVIATLPPVLLFDLLQSAAPGTREYAAARMRDLGCDLGRLSGREPAAAELWREIGAADKARAAGRLLVELRRGVPRLAGAEALPLLGGCWQIEPGSYTALAAEAAAAIALRAPLPGPRVLLAGAPVDTPALHAAIEAEGAVVVDEIGPHGNDVAEGAGALPRAALNAAAAGDVFGLLADRYRESAQGARTPRQALARRLEGALDAVDAVVVSLPPEDAVFGFDYPWLRDALARRGIPHCIVRGEPAYGAGAADRAQIAALVARAVPGRAASHG
jgi:hypothetical protein